MIETIVIGIKKLLGIGWHIGFTSGRDKFPTATFHCPFCHQITPYVAQHRGFCGISPKATCCKDSVPYPVGDAEFAAHLLKKPIWWNGERTPSRLIDTWDEGQL